MFGDWVYEAGGSEKGGTGKAAGYTREETENERRTLVVDNAEFDSYSFKTEIEQVFGYLFADTIDLEDAFAKFRSTSFGFVRFGSVEEVGVPQHQRGAKLKYGDVDLGMSAPMVPKQRRKGHIHGASREVSNRCPIEIGSANIIRLIKGIDRLRKGVNRLISCIDRLIDATNSQIIQ